MVKISVRQVRAFLPKWCLLQLVLPLQPLLTASSPLCWSLLESGKQDSNYPSWETSTAKEHWNPAQHQGGATTMFNNPAGSTGGGQAQLQGVLAVPLTAALFLFHLLNQKSAKGHQAMKVQSEEVQQKLILGRGRLFYLKLQRQLNCTRGQCQETNISRAGRSSHRLWMFHILQRRVLSSLKEQSLRE